MTALDDLTALTYHVQRISQAWPVYARTRADHRRGADPPRSLGDGGSRGTGAPSTPSADLDDRALDSELADIERHFENARKELAAAELLVFARITPVKPLEDPQPRSCDNPQCDWTHDGHGVDPRRYAGGRRLCGRCYQHHCRHTKHYPLRADGTLVHPWARRGDEFVKIAMAGDTLTPTPVA